ncbi:phosphotransacetylase family protein [Chamaesiphon sp. VAR_48_metabat_135_sub]|uniref:phosphotransacetylase family protein n=1 Tax=Chamaesiphon sp. VAR_48_metabat_135_sub TaxID=2964699 RepID=UPI00286A41D4|nr:phosphotransacetylase family protein [Chamaesiphon sp. VAR_48_metabat_135_sub]
MKYLLVASTEACSGKSATILGIADRLQDKGIQIAYTQPLVTGNAIDPLTLVNFDCNTSDSFDSVRSNPLGTSDRQQTLETRIDNDVQLMAQALSLPAERLGLPLLVLDAARSIDRLTGIDRQDYAKLLKENIQQFPGDLVILEGGANLHEGSLFNLAAAQVAETLDAGVLLVNRYDPLSSIDLLLTAQQQLGNRLLGCIINDIPRDRVETVQTTLVPYLEQSGIPVFGIVHRNGLLRSVTVKQLVEQLDAEVLCRPDRLDLMVESLSIGAMNVNSALEYFRRGNNMAVVTGGDRADIQLAALETSTQCLILTGHLPPQPFIVSRAEDLEIPILSVDLDTLTTVEIIDRAFGQVRLQEAIKINCARELFGNHFEIDRLMSSLGL